MNKHIFSRNRKGVSGIRVGHIAATGAEKAGARTQAIVSLLLLQIRGETPASKRDSQEG